MSEPRHFALQVDSMFADLTIQIEDQGTTIRNAKEEARELYAKVCKERDTLIAECRAKVEAASVEYRRADEEYARRI